MRKKLTERSFGALEKKFPVLSKEQQKKIVGGGYFDDYGIGYYDASGNYYWTRTQADTGGFGSSLGNFWNSGNSEGFASVNSSEMYEHDAQNGSGTARNPITVDQYNTLVRMDRWFGGYVDKLGYVGTFASSVEYGNSVYLGSWYSYGDANYPVREPDFFQLLNDGKWNGGYVEGFGYVSSEATIPGFSSPATGSINAGGVNISVNRTCYGDNSTMSYFLATAYDRNGNVISSLSGVFLEPGAYYEKSKVEGSDTAIMPGSYSVVQSTYHGENGYYEVTGVEGRSAIKIHAGNAGGDTSGCFLPGVSGSQNVKTGEYVVSDSREMLNQLNSFFDRYGSGGITMDVSM